MDELGGFSPEATSGCTSYFTHISEAEDTDLITSLTCLQSSPSNPFVYESGPKLDSQEERLSSPRVSMLLVSKLLEGEKLELE